ncbi:MAG: hypothetical protein ACLUFF_05545, partial [Acutalibacteraceae bacterium]
CILCLFPFISALLQALICFAFSNPYPVITHVFKKHNPFAMSRTIEKLPGNFLQSSLLCKIKQNKKFKQSR